MLIGFTVWYFQGEGSIASKLQSLGSGGGPVESVYDTSSGKSTNREGELYYMVSSVVVDAASTSPLKKSYIKSGFAMNVDTKKDLRMLEKNEAEVVNVIRSTLTGMDISAINDPAVQERIKAQIKVGINKKLGQNVVQAVYLDQLLGQ